MTCPPLKGQLEAVDAVYVDFSDRAEFLFIYVREAHPDSVLSVVNSNQKEGLLKIPQASSLTERVETAAVCQRTMELKMPIAIDSMDNKTSRDYAGWPNRCVVVGTDGRVLYKAEVGPSSTNAQRLRSWLTANLTESPLTVGPAEQQRDAASERAVSRHGFSDEQREVIRTALRGGVERKFVPGGALLIIHQGEPVFREGFGLADMESQRPFTPDAPCRIASLTKLH